jgi:diguanylate cyclase (GGDEF)-like protein
MEPARAIPAALRRRPGARPPAGGLRPAESEGEALLRVAAAAAGTHELDEVLEVAAEEARAAVSAASLSVSRWERERGTLRTVINVGDLGPGEERYPTGEVYPLRDDHAGSRLLREGVAYFNAVDDADADPWAAARLRRLGKDSEVGVPILVEGEAWGEVYATTAPGQPRFRSEDVRFLEAVAGQLAVAIGRAELFSRVSRLAYEDPLTGLANRRAVEERLERAMTRANDRTGALAVLLCDVDELKAINDEEGHDAGDRALRSVAEALVAAAAARPGNLVGRLAGDEFCVIMEGGTLEDARGLAATTLAALARNGGQLLISCGAAALGAGVSSPAQLLRAADAALYRAKRNGGGQIFTAGSRAPEPASRPDRRTLRRSTRERIRDAVQDLTERFEGDLAGEGPLERIEAVASHLAEALNAAAWAVSFAPAGRDTIHTVSVADGRDQRLEGLRMEVDNDVYVLAEYPATARLVAAGAGSFVVRADDPGADPAERAVIEEIGRAAVLAAAAADHDGTWLLELYADGYSAAMEEARLEAGLLMRAALPPRPAGKGGGALLERRNRQLQLTSALAARLAASSNPTEMMLAVGEELHSALGTAATGVMCLRGGVGSEPHEVLDMAVGLGLFGDPYFLGFTQPADRGLIGRCLREGRAVRAADVSAEPDYYSTAVTRGVRSELDMPVLVAGRPWGAITLQDLHPGAFDEEDTRLVTAVADQLAAALRAAALYDQLERAYLGTAEALSAALEAKDSYTAEHSRSLVQRAEAVGRTLGMPEAELRGLRYAAAFHDIGKLAVPEAILNKPGPLTSGEREVVERHTVIGEQILSPVEFLSDVLPLVRSAHERFDGSGYPDGLAGEQIPLGARIVFACDTYDAMTTDRPYRAALDHEQAVAELRRVGGSQLDPRVVEALIEILG